MTIALNETHDPARRSFVESANAPGSDFPIQNLPFGVFCPDTGERPRVGVAIGDQILDIAAATASFGGPAAEAPQGLRSATPQRADVARAAGVVGVAAGAVAKSERRSRRQELAAASHADGAGGAHCCRPRSATSPISTLRSSTPPMPAAHVSAGQSADAELQIPAGRLSRPRLVGSRQRHGGEAAARPAQARRGSGAELRAIAQSRFRARARLLYRRAVAARRHHPDRRRGRAYFRLLSCSTTGRHATSRAGNISRSDRSSEKTSPPPSRRGW
jgi:hypothetical protein